VAAGQKGASAGAAQESQEVFGSAPWKQGDLNSRILICDLSWSIPAMAVALLLHYGTDLNQAAHSVLVVLPFLAATWVIWSLLSVVRPLHGFGYGPDGKFNTAGSESAAVSHLLLSMSGLALILLSGGYLLQSDASRLTLIYFGLLLLAGFILIRIRAYGRPEVRSRREAAHRIGIVIAGRGPLVRESVGKRTRCQGMLGRLAGIFCPCDEFAEAGCSGAAVDTLSASIVALLCAQNVDQLVLKLPGRPPSHLLNLATGCRERGINVDFVPELCELYLLPALTGGLALKPVLDFALKVILSLVALPLAVPARLVVRLTQHHTFHVELAISARVSSVRTAVSRPIPPVSILDR
jgi:hypothetical protein